MKKHVKHVRHGFLHGIMPLVYVAIGWYGGAKFDAPDRLMQTIDGVVITAHAAASPFINRGTEYVAGTAEEFLRDLADQVATAREAEENPEETVAAAALASEARTVPDAQATDNAKTQSDAAVPPEKKFVIAPVSQSVATQSEMAASDIRLCVMKVSNAPRSDAKGVIASGDKVKNVEGAALMLMPATNACLSSGYGARRGKSHTGFDFYSKSGGNVLAAGAGVVIEAVTRSDYGNMIVIDHGDGVFTRYAHLRRFASGVHEGVAVTQGQVLGPIGSTGATSVNHLHYEVLTGDYSTRSKSFGLDPVNLYAL